MRFSIFRFIGTPDQLLDRLDQLTRQNVIYLQHCELCGGLSKGDICLKCEPLFRRWTKKIATEMAATREPGKHLIQI